MATIIFTPNCATTVRAQPVYPVGTNLCLSNCTRGSVKRGSTLKYEAQRRNSDFSSKLNKNARFGGDELESEKEAVKSIVERITSSVLSNETKPTRRSLFEPKEKASELFVDNEASGHLPKKSTRNDSDKKGASPSKSVSKRAVSRDIRSSKPLSRFDNLIRNDDKIDNNEPKRDFKPSRPPSKFVRRSPIPKYKSTQEPPKTIIPTKEEPLNMVVSKETSENVTIQEEPLNMVVSEETSESIPTIEEQLNVVVTEEISENIPIEEESLHRVFSEEKSKEGRLESSDKSEEESKVERLELSDKLQELQLELSDKLQELELERLKVDELKEIAKGKGLKGYSRLKKADLVRVLMSLTA